MGKLEERNNRKTMNWKIRFNLGRGENFMKWRITDTRNNESFYLDPDLYTLTIKDCKLRNQKGTAKKIHEGSNKSVCAWIDCEDILIGLPKDIKGEKLTYNPRENPYWTLNGENVDGQRFIKLFTSGSKVIICEKS